MCVWNKRDKKQKSKKTTKQGNTVARGWNFLQSFAFLLKLRMEKMSNIKKLLSIIETKKHMNSELKRQNNTMVRPILVLVKITWNDNEIVVLSLTYRITDEMNIQWTHSTPFVYTWPHGFASPL